MKKLVAIFIAFLLCVQTVQFAIISSSENITVSITLDEDIETKEKSHKKTGKEYPYSPDAADLFTIKASLLFHHLNQPIPFPPALKKLSPPPDQSC
jgi:hypothetical protein